MVQHLTEQHQETAPMMTPIGNKRSKLQLGPGRCSGLHRLHLNPKRQSPKLMRSSFLQIAEWKVEKLAWPGEEMIVE